MALHYPASTATGTVGAPVRRRRRRTFGRELVGWVSLPLVLWALVWLSINTGPWNLHLGALSGGLSALVNGVRASFPLMALAVALFALLTRGRQHRPTAAEAGFWLYATVMLIASLQVSGGVFNTAYWAFAYLGALAVGQLGLSSREPLEFARRLNVLSWLAVTLALVTLLVVAREALYAQGMLSGYGVVTRMGDVSGMPMSRSSGLSRMAVVPAVIALVGIFSARGAKRFGAMALLAASFLVIWIMQSRGSLFSFLGAFLFVLFMHGRTSRQIGYAVCIGLPALIAVGLIPESFLSEIWNHVTRSTGAEGFTTMSGRFNIWNAAWREISNSPIIGHGAQADRRLLNGTNAQNAVIYAVMNAGFLGAAGFVLATLLTWLALARLVQRRHWMDHDENTMLMITGAIVVFSTLRSIPENNAAVFSIDLLLQYAAMIYIVLMDREVRRRRRAARRVRRRRPGEAGVAMAREPIR